MSGGDKRIRIDEPTDGRIINADQFASTGQGFLGYNMFAYCGNNPVIGYDPTGKYVDWDLYPNALTGTEFTQWNLRADESELGHDGNSTFNAKCKKSINAIVKNCEVSAGLGLGLNMGLDFLSIASADIGINYDLVHVEYSGGNWSASQHYFMGIEGQFVKVYLFEHTENESGYKAIDGSGGWKKEESVGLPTIPLGGASFYFFGGGSLSFGYDLEGLWNDFSSIWGY